MTSNAASLYVRPPIEAPAIRTQPRAKVVQSGDSVTFYVAADGTAPLLYRWKKEDNFITNNSEEPSLVIENVAKKDAGIYSVRIMNDAGVKWSETATLSVDPETPYIVSQPSSESVAEGDSVALSVEAIGSGKLSYQWSKDGDKIPAAINPDYSIKSITFENEGEYHVVISNGFGTEKSRAAYLEVRDKRAAYITQQPYSQVITEGDTMEFSVVASGDAPHTHQWTLNGVILPNAKSNTLKIVSADFTDQGTYRVLVQNAFGRDSSGPFKLQVHPKPIAPQILVQPEPQSVEKGEAVVLSVEVAGEKPFTYQWKKDRAPITKADRSTYRIENAQPEMAGIYRVEVTNKFGYAISKPVRVEVVDLDTATIDSITINGVHSNSMAVWLGDSVELKIKATGRKPLTYWWEHNGKNNGDNGGTFKIKSFQMKHVGTHTGRVRNESGESSSFIILTVRNPGFTSITMEPDNTLALAIDAPIGRQITLERSIDLNSWDQLKTFVHQGELIEILTSQEKEIFFRLKIKN